VLLGFLEGQAARRHADLPQEERRRAVAECFGRFFGPEAAEPVAYVDRAWGADEWSRGCYGGFMAPGAWSDHGAALREPIGSLHWAGAETALVWNGYMDGAVGSGQEAARAVAAALA
jgi:monoamine oxidase